MLPDVGALLSAGTRLAELLGVRPAPDAKMRAKLEEILFERENFGAFQDGILQREELRNLILAHLQTLVCGCAGVDEPSENRIPPELEREVERALFG